MLHTDKNFSKGTVALRGNENQRKFGLGNALMMMYAFSSAEMNTVLMHASVIRKDGIGYPFLGVSGTGKSTHTANWLNSLKEQI